MNLPQYNSGITASVVRLVGYGIFVLWIFDVIATIIPPRFTDPVWEFETMGRLVESVGWALISIAMIFFGEEDSRPKFELILVKGISWFCLVLAIFYFLMLPLGLANSWRLKNKNDVQVRDLFDKNNAPLEQIETKLSKASSDQEIQSILLSLVPANSKPNIPNPQEVKTKLLTEISSSKQKLRTETDKARANYFKLLVKNSVKWNLGTVICAVLFVYLWRFSSVYRSFSINSKQEW